MPCLVVPTKHSVTSSFPDQRTVLKEAKSEPWRAVTTSWGAGVIIHAQDLTFLPLNTPIFVMGITALDLSRDETSQQLESMFRFSDSWDVASVLSADEMWAKQTV